MVGRPTQIARTEETEERTPGAGVTGWGAGVVFRAGSPQFVPGSFGDRINRTAKAYTQALIDAVEGRGGDLGAAFEAARQQIVQQAAARRAAAEAIIARMSATPKPPGVAPTQERTSTTHSGPKMEARIRPHPRTGTADIDKAPNAGQGGRTAKEVALQRAGRSGETGTTDPTSKPIPSRNRQAPEVGIKDRQQTDDPANGNGRGAAGIPTSTTGTARVMFGAKLPRIHGRAETARRAADTATNGPAPKADKRSPPPGRTPGGEVARHAAARPAIQPANPGTSDGGRSDQPAPIRSGPTRTDGRRRAEGKSPGPADVGRAGTPSAREPPTTTIEAPTRGTTERVATPTGDGRQTNEEETNAAETRRRRRKAILAARRKGVGL